MIVSHYLSGFRTQINPAERHIGAPLELRLHQVLALLLLVLFSPLMAIIALLIARHDGAPILFGHFRVGRNGALFKCYKFRSMAINAQELLQDLLSKDSTAREEWERDQKLTRDPRVTAIGKFLRITSLDELPQLLNVVRGEMLLVGPRPITVAELSRYRDVRWHYLSVYPGITGLWQVSGRNNTTYDERVQLDKKYVDERNIVGDVRILLATLGVVLTRNGAR